MASVSRLYEDFQPPSDWVREADCDTLVVDLPGFKREQLKVQLDQSGLLTITGECPVKGKKWRRFSKEARVPDNCNFAEIQAKFEDGVLYLTMPKTITWEETYEEQASPAKESPTSQKTGEMLKPDDNASGTQVRDGRGVDDKKAPSAFGAEEQKKEFTGAAEVKNEMKKKESTGAAEVESEMKRKEEKQDADEEKDVDGSREKRGFLHGGLVLGLNESRQPVMNTIVAFLVVVALCIYVIHMFRSPNRAGK